MHLPFRTFLHSFLHCPGSLYPQSGDSFYLKKKKNVVWLLPNRMDSINSLPKTQIKHSTVVMNLGEEREEGSLFSHPKTVKLPVLFCASEQIFLVHPLTRV